MKILTIVGTRPNFIKITQFHKVCAKYDDIEYKLLHTGQHFDKNMSEVFFNELQIPEPDYYLDCNSGSVIELFTDIMLKLEKVLLEYKPDLVLVPGDVNSTFAAAFTAHKLGIKVGHIESGLRSFDKDMPEENNRILTDGISDLYFVTEKSGYENLIKEGHSEDRIHFVGNTMIDTLVAFTDKIDESVVLEKLNIQKENYVLMTMHRPATVDTKEGLGKLYELLKVVDDKIKIVFPIHPRTTNNLKKLDLWDKYNSLSNINFCEPLGYLDFQKLIKNSKCVVTDSGGIQEETTFYQTPCITLRANTERPSTIELGSNTLHYFDADNIIEEFMFTFDLVMDGKYKKGEVPPLWDGKATERIVEVLRGDSNK